MKAGLRYENKRISKSAMDWGLLSIVAALLMVGVVMVFSASFPYSMWGAEQPFYFLARQLIWLGIGVAAMLLVSYLPYAYWQRSSIVLMGVTLLALLIVIVLGAEKYGAKRTFFDGSVQPSEPAKIVIVAYIAAWLASKGERIRNVRVGLLPFGILLGVITVLIMLQPSISTAILIVSTASIMFFIAGADLKQIGLIVLGGAVTFWLIVQYSDYANSRMDKYLDSIWNPLNSAEWQVRQQTLALARGGLAGAGIGQGEAQQVGYLPLSWTDNIFAVIGEESGLIGALMVTLLFGLLAYRGLRIALRAPDHYGMLFATGITSLLVLQALLNAAVIVAAVPPTGVTLPFISYGGSSLVTVMAAIGILLNIGRSSAQPNKTEPTLPVRTGQTKKTSDLNQVGSRGTRARLAAIWRVLAYARINFGWGNRRARLSSVSGRSATRRRLVRSDVRSTPKSQPPSRSQPTPAGNGEPRRSVSRSSARSAVKSMARTNGGQPADGSRNAARSANRRSAQR